MSKIFKQIPKKAKVMLDANVVIYALYPLAQHHTACKHLLDAVQRVK